MSIEIRAKTDCTVVLVEVSQNDVIRGGDTIAIVEMMKIEHLLAAPVDGTVISIAVAPGQVIAAGTLIASMEPGPIDAAADAVVAESPRKVRADLRDVQSRQARLADGARPEAMAKIHSRGRRSARENIADLVDADSFEEYGGLMYAGQTKRRTVDDLIATTPADGIVGGLCRINGDHFDDAASRCAVMSYDYSVLAGTQGFRSHQKKDRLLEVVDRLGLPIVLFAEGGGGRPGDTDSPDLSGLEIMSFAWLSRLSGKVPSVAVVSGRCFAGNAALAAVCDVIIATPDANLGMAGPAMIEGGGLGVFTAEEIGSVDIQCANGVIDLLVEGDAAAVATTKQYLSYFQGPLVGWTAHRQDAMRDVVPENRKRVYDVRCAVNILCDVDSVLELRPTFGRSIITVLGRIEGRPVGIIANDPAHLGGAIDANSADKGARFMQLCDGHGLPLISLCDTPGFMVGPVAEKSAQVRHFGRLFVTGASLTVPLITIVLRKAVGLGAMAMSGGSFHATVMTLAWPTGEVSAMGIEGAVTLGSRRELDAAASPEARTVLYDELVGQMYAHSNALNAAAHHEIDDVIDPATTRPRVVNLLRAMPPHPGGHRPMIDTW